MLEHMFEKCSKIGKRSKIMNVLIEMYVQHWQILVPICLFFLFLDKPQPYNGIT